MKATKSILSKAAELNATIEIWSDSENSYTIEALAPDNMQWVESAGCSLVARWFTYAKDSKGEAMDDILNRMNKGLQAE